jgi:hypothetical protein
MISLADAHLRPRGAVSGIVYGGDYVVMEGVWHMQEPGRRRGSSVYVRKSLASVSINRVLPGHVSSIIHIISNRITA